MADTSRLNHPESWRGLSDAERTGVAREVIATMPGGWTVGERGHLLHEATQLEFALVPGGTLRMGISAADVSRLAWFLEEHARSRALASFVLARGFAMNPGAGPPREQLRAAVERLSPAEIEEAQCGAEVDDDLQEVLDAVIEAARPVRDVAVTPFACARRVLRLDDARRLTGEELQGPDAWMVTRDVAQRLAGDCRLRLPSEAELEWLARECSDQTFTWGLSQADRVPGAPFFRTREQSWLGVEDGYAAQWAADDRHPTYDGAPGDSRAWLQGAAAGIVRGGVDPETIMSWDALIEVLAGFRGELAKDDDGDWPPQTGGVRLVADVSMPASPHLS